MENFGVIKDTFNTILAEAIILKNEEGKKLFNSYLKTLKDYIKENINLLKGLDKEVVNEGIKKLNTLLKDKEINSDNMEFYSHIDVLSTTPKTPTTLD